MNRLGKIFLLLLFTATVQAQNIVPNPNFALFNSCPTGLAQIGKCMHWYLPSAGTTDYFNACHDTLSGSMHSAGVPDNAWGSQAAASNAYIGIGTLAQSIANYREYAGVVIPSLMSGASYRVLLRLSLSEASYAATAPPAVFFFKNMDTLNMTMSALPYLPQVEFNYAGHIADKINWVTVTDTFTASDAFTHLLIGNFRNDAFTSYTTLPGGSASVGCLFYIDSVAVEKIADPSFVVNMGGAVRVRLLPNPVVENVALTVGHMSGKAELTITNIQGQVVRRLEGVEEGTTVISCSGLAAGVYYCRLYVDGRMMWYDKMVVRGE
jgi:hypothetical protein